MKPQNKNFKNIKICFDFTSLHKQSGGYIQYCNTLLNLIDELNLSGAKLTIVLHNDSRKLLKSDLPNNALIIEFSAFSKLRRLLFFALKKFDLVLFPGNVSTPFVCSKCITVIHDTKFLDLPSSVKLTKRMYRKFMLYFTLKTSSAFVAISHYTKDSLLYKFPKISKIKIIHTEVSPKKETGESFRKKLGNKPPDFLCISTGFKHKRTRIFLDIARAMPLNEFILVSSEELIDLPANLSKVSNLSRKDLLSLVRSVKVVVLPSNYEGLGMVFWEAACLGRRICATDLPVYKEAPYEGAIFLEERAEIATWVHSLRVLERSPEPKPLSDFGKNMIYEYKKLMMEVINDF